MVMLSGWYFVTNNSKILKNEIKNVSNLTFSNFCTIELVALSAPITRLLKLTASVVSTGSFFVKIKYAIKLNNPKKICQFSLCA
jgi:Ran GTPase-activating protein (RanGAP) involved in mRNA processing and transport